MEVERERDRERFGGRMRQRDFEGERDRAIWRERDTEVFEVRK